MLAAPQPIDEVGACEFLPGSSVDAGAGDGSRIQTCAEQLPKHRLAGRFVVEYDAGVLGGGHYAATRSGSTACFGR
jgi:hypothetical protein